MEISILYICTGKYKLFFNGFFHSSEEFLMPQQSKKYYVFTDDFSIVDSLSEKQKARVHLIHKECAGFPLDSLLRFETFLTVKDEILTSDYVYFFNANVQFIKPVGDEILPDETGLVAELWPRQNARPACMFPYERRKVSTAYIPPYKGPYHYFSGFMNGGTSKRFIEMADTLAKNIRKDMDNGIVAIVHDESHLNAYLHRYGGKCLPTFFGGPQEWKHDPRWKMLLRDKVSIDPYFNKGRKQGVVSKLGKGVKKIINAIRWYLYI